MAYNLKHTGAEIDAQIDRVIDGSVVVNNTLSELDETSNKPVDSKGIASAIEAASNKLKERGYIYMGVATPATDPGVPDGPVFYLASTSGDYPNFQLAIPSGVNYLCAFMWKENQWFNIKVANLGTPESTMYLEQGSIDPRNGKNQERQDTILFAKRVRTAGYIHGGTTVVANEGIIVRTVYRYSLDGTFEESINPEPSNTFTTSDGYKWRLAFAKSDIEDFINVEDVFGKTLASTLDVSLHNIFYPIKDSAPITFTDDSVTIGVGVVSFRSPNLGLFSFRNENSITFEFANAPSYSFYVLDYQTLEFKNVTVLLPSYIVLLEFSWKSKISGGVWAGWYSEWYSEWYSDSSSNRYYPNLSHDYYRDGVKRLNGYITPSETNTTSVSFQRTEDIIVEKGDIIRWRSSCYGDTYALAFFDTSKKLIDGVFGTSYNKISDYEYVVPNNGFIVFSFRKVNGLAFHIEKSANSQNMIIPTIEAGKRYSKMRDFGTQPAADGSSGSFMNIADDYNTLINNIYEPLRSVNPDYISRVSAGKDATGTYEQWVYTFEPPYWQQSILLVGGVHANEEDSIAGLARIMQMITNEYEEDEDLTYIRQNVKITVVPVVNVWGYSQSPKVRNNADNISIQTWTSDTPIAEVANLKPIFTALAPELAFAVDMHTTTNNSYLDFYGVINKYCKNVRTLFRVNAWLTQHYAIEGGVKEQLFGYLNMPELLGSWLFGELEIPTSTLELSDYHWDTSKATSKVQTMGVTMWLNYIIQQINDNYNPAQFIDEADYKIVKG